MSNATPIFTVLKLSMVLTDVALWLHQDRAVQSVMKVLLSFKAAEIDAAVAGLDTGKLDVLMKYIYRGFETPSEGSSAQLLVWHDRVGNPVLIKAR